MTTSFTLCLRRGPACARAAPGRAARADRARGGGRRRRPKGLQNGVAKRDIISFLSWLTPAPSSIRACATVHKRVGVGAHHHAVKLWRFFGPSAPMMRGARGQGGPCAGRASRGRSRCARAASARRDREIDRVAAQHRLVVQRRPGPDIAGHVGDGDRKDEAAGVRRILVRARMDGSSWSFASNGSMVTSGRSRQSSRPFRVTEADGLRFRDHGVGKTCGMPRGVEAIRLACFSGRDVAEALDHRAISRPRRVSRIVSTATSSPSSAPAVSPARCRSRGRATSCRREPIVRRRRRGRGRRDQLLRGLADGLEDPGVDRAEVAAFVMRSS